MALDFSKFGASARSIMSVLTAADVPNGADSGRLLLELLAAEPALALKLGLDNKACVQAVASVNIREADVDGFSANVRRAVQLAEIEAWRDNAGLINPGHLLLGLLNDKSSRAALALRNMGVNAHKARAVLSLSAQPAANAGGTTESMDDWVTDLVESAKNGDLDPVIGRDTELARLMQVLSRRRKNNPVLIGPAGVGKTAVVEGLAIMAANGALPGRLNISKIYALDLAALVAGTKYRGEFEARLKQLLKLTAEHPDYILFIDEIHMLMGAGGADSALDASNILKPALSRGEIRCIGATTPAEYQRHIEKDAAFARRFQPVTVNEPSVEVTLQILAGLRPLYQNHHGVGVADEMLEFITHNAARYVHGRYFPDKAIDLLDEAQAQAGLQADIEADGNLRKVDVAAVLHQWTGLPEDVLLDGYGPRLLKLEQVYAKGLFGQDAAVKTLLSLLKRRLVLHKPDSGVILMQGPPASGKTTTVELLTETVYDNRNIRELDLAAYGEKHSLSGLIGTTQGYVGYGEKPLLSQLLQQSANGLLVLRNFSRAHGAVRDLLAGLMQNGVISDGAGQELKTCNTLFIVIEESGADLPLKAGQAVAFTAPGQAALGQIGDKLLDGLAQTLGAQGFSLSYTPAVRAYLYGFTGLAQITQAVDMLEDLCMDAVLNDAAEQGQTLHLDMADGKFMCTTL